MNIPYEMFLIIQMHLTCRKDRIHNRLQAKKNEEQVTTVQRQRIIWQVQWHHWWRTFQPPRRKGRPVQEEWCQGAVSRPEEKFIVPSCNGWKSWDTKTRFVAWGYEETFAVSKSLNTYMMSLMNILTFATRLIEDDKLTDGCKMNFWRSSR